MSKVVDKNGYWSIKDNPITKAGVFPYLGRQISPQLEPDKIYMVYRPAEELTNDETVSSFNAVPFIDEHEMLGEGFTKYDDRPAGGVVYNVRADGDKLVGDFKIYSESLKDEITSGKKELSLGYLCEYELAKGVYNGQRYDAIQKNISGNHIALVDRGRMGSDVRVYDKAITFDSMAGIGTEAEYQDEIPSKDGSPKGDRADSSPQLGVSDMTEIETKDSDKREVIREIMAIAAKPDTDFEGGEAEKIETIAKLLEESEYSKSEAGTANDEAEEEKAEDKCGKDEEVEEKVESEEKKVEDEEEEKKDDKEQKKAEDALPRQILKMIAKRDAIAKQVEPLIGSFACDEMTDVETAHYACQKLGLEVSQDEAIACLRGYMAAYNGDHSNKVYGLDNAISAESGVDKATQKYLKGE